MIQYTVYDRPADVPDAFVVRKRRLTRDGNIDLDPHVWTASTLDAARALIARIDPGLVRIPREPADPPQIVETWL